MNQLQFGDIKITWLDGMKAFTDGGTLFGPVPKAVWNRKFPVNEKNQIPQVMDPILLQRENKNYLIDTGIGTSKMNWKEKRNAGVQHETKVEESLGKLELSGKDIDVILQTHMHNDHAGGLTKLENGEVVPVFPNAKIYLNKIEWDEVRNPNARTKGTYLEENWKPVKDQIVTFDEAIEINSSIKMIHTGGHSNGHSIVKLTEGSETIIHMADLLITHTHTNPVWVAAVDDYPMDSIEAKQKWLKHAFENHYKFIFYHDPYYSMIQWDENGKEIVDSLSRDKEPLLSFSEENLQ